MRLIDADKIYVIPATDDNITGMGMTREEQDAYNEGVEAVMAKIRQAQTIDPYKSVLEIIAGVEKDLGSRPVEVWEITRRIKALKGGDMG